MLLFENVSLSRAQTTLIRIHSLQLTTPGVLCLMGTGGVGKSSLLMALSGQTEDEDLKLDGKVTLDGAPIPSAQANVVWVSQHEKLLPLICPAEQLSSKYDISLEQAKTWLAKAGHEDPVAALQGDGTDLTAKDMKALAVLAMLHKPGQLYLLDEPTVGVGDIYEEMIREEIKALAKTACVILVSHNRQDCLEVGGYTALIAGGEIKEFSPTEQFFTNPTTEAGRLYVDTGNCNLPIPVVSKYNQFGVWWVVDGLLCGMSRPGLVAEAEAQAAFLAERGVSAVICLEERVFYPVDPLKLNGIEHRAFSIPDMSPPTFSQAVDICRLAEPLIKANKGVAMHCRGGLGRTGTALACILIWFGDSASQAIDKVRMSEPKAIQSNSQLKFLEDFAERISGWH